jgi:hypothetical protein
MSLRLSEFEFEFVCECMSLRLSEFEFVSV